MVSTPARRAQRARVVVAAFFSALSFATLCIAGSATYDYDPLGRLTTATYDNGAVVNYTLDKAGNRTLVTTSGVADTTPPGQPGTLSFSSITATSATATWT